MSGLTCYSKVVVGLTLFSKYYSRPFFVAFSATPNIFSLVVSCKYKIWFDFKFLRFNSLILCFNFLSIFALGFFNITVFNTLVLIFAIFITFL